MGMFDDVECLYPLPGFPEGARRWFQTKDFDCQLGRYRITEAGELFCVAASVEEWEHGDLPAPVRLDYTGEVRFYTDGDGADWYEYVALFAGGRMIRVERVEPRRLPFAVETTDAGRGGAEW